MFVLDVTGEERGPSREGGQF